MSQIESQRILPRWAKPALMGGVLILIPVGFYGLRSLARLDPFARMRDSSGTPSTSMELQKVDIRQYQGGKLVAKANAERMTISPDRQQFELYDVTNGVYGGSNGDINFVAREALWNQPLRTLYVRNGVQIRNKDMNLSTSEASFDQMRGRLSADKQIKGRLYDGQVSAVQFKYNTENGHFTVGKTTWNGLLAMKIQNGQDSNAPTRWQMKGDSISSTQKDIIEYENGTATDGEIILQAPKVEHNRKTDVVTGTGGVEYFSPESNLVADKVVVYRKEKRAVLTGHVRMLVKPESEQDQPAKVEAIPEFKLVNPEKVDIKPTSKAQTPEEKQAVDDLRSSDSAKKFPTKVYADSIEYWYGKGNRHAIITGNPQARQDFTSGLWRHVWADHATYDGEAEKLTLISGSGGKARMKNSIGDDMLADSFTTSTKKDDETFHGKNMTGSFSNDDDLSEKDKTTAPPQPTTTGGGTSGGATGGTGGPTGGTAGGKG
jgi:lipopolysaccharide assembly outer membrane protein LptD (OstA)